MRNLFKLENNEKRDPSDWTNYNVSVSNIIPRCYTGHEQLTDFALINMNGRLYDPALGRFLSTDNEVKRPLKWCVYLVCGN
ncbi:MAG: hypothetical protein NT007_16300 [Candidatus Kapabacteria bacterium]|nr:hypothetical protein [Candidatus Kapabacteria bacterium]